jgi:prepilin peptidase CpaA
MLVPFSFAMLGLLIWAALRDVATRTIPDSIGLLLVATGGLARMLQGPSALALSLGSALLLFLVLMIAYARGLIGGGDVKVMTALAVGLSPFDSYRFVIATAIASGLLALAYHLLPSVTKSVCPVSRRSLLGRVMTIEAWRIRRRGPLPYGVAIAAGGAFVLLHPGSV